MSKIDQYIQRIEKVAERIGAAFCFILMIGVVLQVLGRYVFKTELIPGLYNIIESYIFPIIVFSTLAGSFRSGMWPRLDILLEKMTPGKARVTMIINRSIEFVLYLTIAVFTLVYAIKMVEEGRLMQAGATTMPLYPVLCIVPVAFFLLCIEIALILWKEQKEKKRADRSE